MIDKILYNKVESLKNELVSTINELNIANGNTPYLMKIDIDAVITQVYNPDFGDERMCVCGHKYYRH